MSETPINLNRARKARARASAKAEADANVAKHGRTRAERAAEAARRVKAARILDQHRREDD